MRIIWATWISRSPAPPTASSALQMDIKIDGITEEIMKVALAQAKQGRLHILGEMNKVITSARTEMSEFAPRLMTMKIHPDKIREVIGKGIIRPRPWSRSSRCRAAGSRKRSRAQRR